MKSTAGVIVALILFLVMLPALLQTFVALVVTVVRPVVPAITVGTMFVLGAAAIVGLRRFGR